MTKENGRLWVSRCAILVENEKQTERERKNMEKV